MITLNLDPEFKPLKGPEISFDSFLFSGGEPHIRIHPFEYTGKVTVTHRIRSFNDLGLFLIAVDALKRLGYHEIEAFIPYFPGARQDRLIISGESLTVKVYANMFNALNLSNITIFDPHSAVTSALLNNCSEFSNHLFVKKVLNGLPNDCLLVSPDAGAEKKVHQLATYLKTYEILKCGKKRDVTTGALSGFKVPKSDLQGRPCLIVDDICDGGGTFIGLAHELKKARAGDLYLAVSHGIFSKGIEKLQSQFTNIFTTDSFKSNRESNVSQIKISELL